MEVYDLSGPIIDGLNWYEGECDPVEVRQIGSLEKEG